MVLLSYIGSGSPRLLGPLYSGKKYPKTMSKETKTKADEMKKKGEGLWLNLKR